MVVSAKNIAAFGSVRLPLTIDGREAFWCALHETAGRLGNRLSADEQAKVMAQCTAAFRW
jgi:hypothetical protein